MDEKQHKSAGSTANSYNYNNETSLDTLNEFELDIKSEILSRDDTFISEKSSQGEEKLLTALDDLNSNNYDIELTQIEANSITKDTLYCSFGEKLSVIDSEVSSITLETSTPHDVVLVWSKNYIHPRVFSKFSSKIRFVAVTILPNTEVLKLLDEAQRYNYHFVERSVVVNTSSKDDYVTIPWKQIMIFRRGILANFNSQSLVINGLIKGLIIKLIVMCCLDIIQQQL